MAAPKYPKKPTAPGIRMTPSERPAAPAQGAGRDDWEELAELFAAYRAAVAVRRVTPRDGTDTSYEASLAVFRANRLVLQGLRRCGAPLPEWRKEMQLFYANHKTGVRTADDRTEYIKDWISLDYEAHSDIEVTGLAGLGYVMARGREIGFPELCLDPAIAAYAATKPRGMTSEYTIAAGEANWRWIFRFASPARRAFIIACAEYVLRRQ